MDTNRRELEEGPLCPFVVPQLFYGSNARSLDPRRRNEDLSRDFRHAALVVDELGGHEVYSGDSNVIAALKDAGETAHGFRPIVHDEADVFRDAQAHLAEPVRHVCVERNQRIGSVLFNPFAKDIGAPAEIVVWKEQERHAALARHALLHLQHGSAVGVLGAGVDPLGNGEADPLVASREELGDGLLNAYGHVPRGAVE